MKKYILLTYIISKRTVFVYFFFNKVITFLIVKIKGVYNIFIDETLIVYIT